MSSFPVLTGLKYNVGPNFISETQANGKEISPDALRREKFPTKIPDIQSVKRSDAARNAVREKRILEEKMKADADDPSKSKPKEGDD